jgi:hypothetical protein
MSRDAFSKPTPLTGQMAIFSESKEMGERLP